MPKLIRCNDPRHPNCGVPVARQEDDGSLTILAKHHGEKHAATVKTQPRPIAR